MTISFKAEGGLDTPYKKAKQIWDERIGSARVQAANWRLISCSLLALNLILIIGLIYVGSQAKIVPYVIEVSKLGEARSVAKLNSQYQVPQASIQYFLAQFIERIRSMPSDKIVARRNLESAYHLLTKRAAIMLNEFFTLTSPEKEFGTKTRSIEIDSILPISDNTFQAEWNEYEYNEEGIKILSQRYRGAFSVLISPQTDEIRIKQNPLGIYIDHFSWSKFKGYLNVHFITGIIYSCFFLHNDK